jgi:hypothetical protein
LYEVLSADRANGEQQTTIGRFDDASQAEAEMRRRQSQQPRRCFYLFIRISDKTRLLINHTL